MHPLSDGVRIIGRFVDKGIESGRRKRYANDGA